MISPDPHSGRGDLLPHSPPAKPLAWRGAQAPGVGTQTLVPLNFSAVVAPLRYRKQDIIRIHTRCGLPIQSSDEHLSVKQTQNQTHESTENVANYFGDNCTKCSLIRPMIMTNDADMIGVIRRAFINSECI